MNRRGTILVLIGILSIVLAAVAISGGRPFSTRLTGAAEVGGGDPDGSGTANLTLNQGQGEICYRLEVSDIQAATAAHIHIGVAGENGPVVVGLGAPTSGTSSGCVDVDPALVRRIMQNPDSFYVNVHNSEYPSGALRGQLGR